MPDRDFFDSVATQAQRPAGDPRGSSPANDNRPPLPARVALALAVMLAIGAVGLVVILCKIMGHP